MTARGFLIALNRDDAKRLFAQRGDEAVTDYLRDLCERAASDGTICDCGELWSALDRCLAGDTPDPQDGELLNQVFLGGRPLLSGDEPAAALVRPDLVPHVAKALQDRTPEWLRSQYPHLAADSDDGGQVNVEALSGLLDAVRDFYRQAAEQRAAVVFTTLS